VGGGWATRDGDGLIYGPRGARDGGARAEKEEADGAPEDLAPADARRVGEHHGDGEGCPREENRPASGVVGDLPRVHGAPERVHAGSARPARVARWPGGREGAEAAAEDGSCPGHRAEKRAGGQPSPAREARAALRLDLDEVGVAADLSPTRGALVREGDARG